MIQEILARLPHRYPFVMIDRVLEAQDGKARAIKNVSANEPQFTGHFPERPIMPGVLIIEGMAQTCTFLLEAADLGQALPMLTGVENARFRKPVTPGDQLVFEATLEYFRRSLGRAHVTASVEGTVVAEADILFAVANPK